MKKLLLLLPVLAFAAAGMTACNKTGSAAGTEAAETAAAGTPAGNASIAYIQMDSLLAHYDMFSELSTAFQDRSTRAENDLASRGRRLESDFASAQDRVQKGLVTSIQARDLEAQLMQKQQEFATYRDQLVAQVAEEEQVMLNRIYNSISEYMKEFNGDHRYGLILTTSGGNPVLHADPAYDITAEVTTGLNAYYAANKENL
jgi:outer membrane protein